MVSDEYSIVLTSIPLNYMTAILQLFTPLLGKAGTRSLNISCSLSCRRRPWYYKSPNICIAWYIQVYEVLLSHEHTGFYLLGTIWCFISAYASVTGIYQSNSRTVLATWVGASEELFIVLRLLVPNLHKT